MNYLNLPPGCTVDEIDRLTMNNEQESKIDEICYEDCGKAQECPLNWDECDYCVKKYEDWLDSDPGADPPD